MSDSDFILTGAPVGPIPDCSLGECLLSKLRSRPQDEIIQVDGDTGVEQTVGEFVASSIKVAEGLKKLGLKENDIVGMMCRNCFEASEIVMGTWFSGAAMSPANGSMKVAEIKHYLDLTKPKVLFCDEEAIDNTMEVVKLVSAPPVVVFVGNTGNYDYPCLRFQEILVEADVKNYKPQPIKSPSTQVVAVPLSSGTSGLPKAVGATHKNFLFQEKMLNLIYPFNSNMICLQISHFFWVTGFLNFILVMSKGRKRVLLKNVTVENILKAIEKYKAEWTLMAPLLAFSIVKSPEFNKYDTSSMKFILLGGSLLTKNIGKTILEKWKHIKILQNYGTTEFTGAACLTPEGGDIYSIGKVTPGVQIKVVDENGKSLKANTKGEILLKSPGIMKGYLGNEEATREAVNSDGWLCTGDLGYYDDSGQVYIVDRIKELVKIMNLQVAPVEIENVILSVPGVRESAVAGVTKDGISNELLALIVKEKNSTVTEDEIHNFLNKNLSEYKQITAGIHFVDSLPKTGSGKLQRREIRKMAQTLYSEANQ